MPVALLVCVALAADAGPAPAPDAGLPPAVAARPGFRLQSGDLLAIQVYDHPDLATELRVPAQGHADFPLIGRLEPLTGRTVEEVAAEIARRLEDGYVRRAVVNITVRAMAPRTAYVIGAVTTPGAIELDPFATVTALQALGRAGGASENGDTRAITLVRADPADPGRQEALPVPIDPAAPPVVLRPGDVIIVPRQDRIFIMGQVTAPGAVALKSGEPLTVSKAIGLAGGFSRFARDQQVLVMRGGQPVQTVNVRAILQGDRKLEDPVLKPGDTVFVPESRL